MSLKLNMSRSNISHERDPDDDCYKAPSSCPASSFPHPSSIFSFKHKYLLEALFFRARVACRKEWKYDRASRLNWSACARELSMIFFYLFYWWSPKWARVYRYLDNHWTWSDLRQTPTKLLSSCDDVDLKRQTNGKMLFFCLFKSLFAYETRSNGFSVADEKKKRLINHKSHNNA